MIFSPLQENLKKPEVSPHSWFEIPITKKIFFIQLFYLSELIKISLL